MLAFWSLSEVGTVGWAGVVSCFEDWQRDGGPVWFKVLLVCDIVFWLLSVACKVSSADGVSCIEDCRRTGSGVKMATSDSVWLLVAHRDTAWAFLASSISFCLASSSSFFFLFSSLSLAFFSFSLSPSVCFCVFSFFSGRLSHLQSAFFSAWYWGL